MKFNLIKRVLCGLLICTALPVFAADKLIFALDIIRHGDRTPIILLPASPLNWPQGLGQLTARGMHQEYELGTVMRKRYVEDNPLLPASYEVKTMWVRATDFDRTLMSAESLLAGLYPLGTGPKLLKSDEAALPQAYQPIPIHTVDLITDNLLIFDSNKAKYDPLYEKYINSRPDWRAYFAKLKDQIPRWSKLTGVNITDLRQLIAVGDALKVRKIYNVPLPVGMSETDATTIMEAGLWAFTTIYKSPIVKANSGLVLMGKINQYLQTASQKPQDLKFVLFSGHDSTIMTAMSAMGAPVDYQPPYASNLSFTLWHSGQGLYLIKVMLNEKPVMIPGCQKNVCTLSQFAKLAQKV